MAKKPSYEELKQSVSLLKQALADCRKTADALRIREERLSQIIQNTPIPTFVIDSNHLITHYNRTLESLTGIPASEVIGTRKQWVAFYAAERPVMADFLVDNASEEELSRYYGGEYRTSAVKKGVYEAEDFFPDFGEEGKWLFFTAAPLKDATGKITGAVETLQDITERKRAEEALRESERRYKTLFYFAPYPMVVFTIDGRVSYLNPAFTEIFGWSLEELEGQRIPYVPPELQRETIENIKRLFKEKVLLRHETKRLTKDGKLLDIIMRGAFFTDKDGEPEGELVILRDVTQEKRIARNNEAMFKISMTLPEYPELEELLDFISGEIKRLLVSEGGVIILVDDERQEVFIPGAAYDDKTIERRAKVVRFHMDQMDQIVAEKVIRTGEPIIVNDTSKIIKSYPLRDEKLGYTTKNFIQVPLKSNDRIIGALSVINKKEGAFDQTDMELLGMIAGTVALSIENARFSEEIREAYREVSSLNRAKDKVINHLSHELKTPVAVLMASLVTLTKRLKDLPEELWKPTIERAKRNLERILQIQYQVDDIMQDKHFMAHTLMSELLEQCGDEMEALIAEEVGEGPVIGRIRKRIEEIFGPKEMVAEKILLNEFVDKRLEYLRPFFSHRRVKIHTQIASTPPLYIPSDPLAKVIDGLIKNAVENTPDEGKIEIIVRKEGEGTEMVVHDYGVGITEENQGRIFEGFFTTRDTMDYSTKRPFDFNAGGKGADLLRMKIFSERYNFKIGMTSYRCRFIPRDTDICPGRISLCPFCKKEEDCHLSGETTFSIHFPPAP
ncbi:MAG: PAS domain S-box protein [Pseudomonadota bacterium]